MMNMTAWEARRRDQCNHCSSRRALHVLWPYEKAKTLWFQIMKDEDADFPWPKPEPLLVRYFDGRPTPTPYIVCGPQSYAFPDVKVVA